MSDWYYARDSQQVGPVSREELQRLLRSELPPATLVWRDGMAQWLPASGVPELMAGLRPGGGTPGRPSLPRADAGLPDDTLNPFTLLGRSFTGAPLSRAQFAVLFVGTYAILAVIGGIGALATAALGLDARKVAIAVGIAALFWVVLALVVNFASGAGRLRDLGLSPLFLLLHFVPIVSCVFPLYLLFAPGRGPGAPPPSSLGVPALVIGAIVLVIGLPVAVGVIGVGAAIVIPSLLRARVSANEATTIGDLRTLVSAQAAYQASNQGYYDGKLSCLGAPATCIPGYTGPAFADPGVLMPTQKGYVRSLTPGPLAEAPNASPSSVSAFVVTAVPITAGQTGVRSFCADHRGLVCAMTNATSATDLLEEVSGQPQCSSSCNPL